MDQHLRERFLAPRKNGQLADSSPGLQPTGPIIAPHAHGVTFLPKANTSTSNRQKAAYMKSVTTLAKSTSKSKRSKNIRAHKKSRNQKQHLVPVHLPPDSATYPSDFLNSSLVFIDGGNLDSPAINPVIDGKGKKKPKPMHILSVRNNDLFVPTSHFSDHNRGLMFKPSVGPSQFILVPRQAALQTTGCLTKPARSTQLCTALDNIQSAQRSTDSRGTDRIVIRDNLQKYSCTGTKSRRNRTGIEPVHYTQRRVSNNDNHRVLAFFKQVEFLFQQYIDTDQVRLIHDALELMDTDTFTTGNNKSSSIYGAIAHGVNVYLNVHQDLDFTYCALSIQMKKEYTLIDDVVAYFCFPRLGIAVPIKPGDVLFFNPQEPHCVSSRCTHSDSIYCTSLYIKSANLGLNNNSLPLLPVETALLREYKSTHGIK